MSTDTGSAVADHVARAWTDLLTAASAAGWAVDELVRAPAGPEAVEAAERAIGRHLPPELAALYRLSDGQVGWYGLTTGPGGNPNRERGDWVGSLFGTDWSFAPLQKLVQDWQTWDDVRAQYSEQELAEDFDDSIEVRDGDPVKGVYTHADWIPFAIDGGGNALAADLAPEPGGRIGQVIVTGSDEDLRRVIAPSVVELLRWCAHRVQTAGEPTDARGVAGFRLED
jgi:cell wall assembly regulator SMI1